MRLYDGTKEQVVSLYNHLSDTFNPDHCDLTIEYDPVDGEYILHSHCNDSIDKMLGFIDGYLLAKEKYDFSLDSVTKDVILPS